MDIQYDTDGTIASVTVPHFDPHIHMRRRPMKEVLLREAALRMNGGIAEPNTASHLLTFDDVDAYVEDMHVIAPGRSWAASIYLTPHTSLQEVARAWERGLIGHVKGYPPHGTTHAEDAVPPSMLLDINSPVGKLLCGLAEMGVPFKTHGEIVAWNGKPVHPQRREGLWYREAQPRLDELYKHRGLRQIHAHISSSEAARYMIQHGNPDSCVCELTGHHLIDSWMLQYDGGFLQPDHHWLPVSKDEENTEDLRDLVRKMLAFVHAGSDMAGHDTRRKYAQRAFGGGFTYHCSLELFVEVLEMLGVMEYAHDFLYGNAKRFHGRLVPDDPAPFHLVRQDWTVGERTPYADGEMTPFGYDAEKDKRRIFRFKLAA